MCVVEGEVSVFIAAFRELGFGPMVVTRWRLLTGGNLTMLGKCCCHGFTTFFWEFIIALVR